jgi:hypothetical protein
MPTSYWIDRTPLFSVALLILALAAKVVLTAAIAQPERPPDMRFDTYFRSAPARDANAAAIRDQIAGWPIECDDAKISAQSHYRILKAVRFDKNDTAPSSGTWVESVTVKLCGAEHIFNVQTNVRNGEITLDAMLSGSSIATFALQNDTLGYVRIAAQKNSGGDCEQIFVIDTAFLGFEGEPIADALDGPQSRAWREDWTAWACGKEIVLPVFYVPDASGTAISVKSSQARLK